MTLSEFQVRIEAVIAGLEKLHDRQYPLRSIPMDMVAEAVVREATASGQVDIDDRMLAIAEQLNPTQVATILNIILARNMAQPRNAWSFSAGPDTYDISSPWQTGSYVFHSGTDRLRDGT